MSVALSMPRYFLLSTRVRASPPCASPTSAWATPSCARIVCTSSAAMRAGSPPLARGRRPRRPVVVVRFVRPFLAEAGRLAPEERRADTGQHLSQPGSRQIGVGHAGVEAGREHGDEGFANAGDVREIESRLVELAFAEAHV